MSYEVVFKRKVRRAVVRLPDNIYERITRRIDDLAENPRPRGARKVQGIGQEEWRLRVGDHRVVYLIQEPHPESGDGELRGLVTVLAVGHRQGIYG